MKVTKSGQVRKTLRRSALNFFSAVPDLMLAWTISTEVTGSGSVVGSGSAVGVLVGLLVPVALAGVGLALAVAVPVGLPVGLLVGVAVGVYVGGSGSLAHPVAAASARSPGALSSPPVGPAVTASAATPAVATAALSPLARARRSIISTPRSSAGEGASAPSSQESQQQHRPHDKTFATTTDV